MGALKALVVAMGVLLVGGTAALIVAIVDRASHRTPAPSGRGFDPVAVDLPLGARILASEVAGDRILVRIGLADGSEQLIVIDLRNGARLGTVDLRISGTRP